MVSKLTQLLSLTTTHKFSLLCDETEAVYVEKGHKVVGNKEGAGHNQALRLPHAVVEDHVALFEDEKHAQGGQADEPDEVGLDVALPGRRQPAVHLAGLGQAQVEGRVLQGGNL